MQQNFRVLLVEDDDSLRVCLREFLADNGWAVAATAHGEEAIQLARIERFDFSILDFHLAGGTTGLQVFQAIRQIHPVPAILMSGAANREETDLAKRAGFFTFLRKPLQLDLLRQSLEMLIAHHFGAPGGHGQPDSRGTPGGGHPGGGHPGGGAPGGIHPGSHRPRSAPRSAPRRDPGGPGAGRPPNDFEPPSARRPSQPIRPPQPPQFF